MTTRPEMGFPPFDVSLNDLKSLMEFSGNEAKEVIDNHYGGTAGLCKRLQTDPDKGISGNLEELIRRRNIFGTNQIPEQPPKSFLSFIIESTFWKTSLLLIIIVILLGLYEPSKDECIIN